MRREREGISFGQIRSESHKSLDVVPSVFQGQDASVRHFDENSHVGLNPPQPTSLGRSERLVYCVGSVLLVQTCV